ncbi:Class V chitinase Chi100 [Tolypocladium capitatum]|uniref:chitinase n=1 Tax=Tolypocladium capitatum TaxID=45235 RepID=A0A2K3QKT8_9HYPO|nr:Class V chitinase Chi100 [Tolypocladium capitatum]
MRHPILAMAIFVVAFVWPILGALAVNAATEANVLSAYQAGHPSSTVATPASSTSTDRASLRAAVLAGNFTSRLSYATRKRCPESCSSAGVDPSAWFAYHSIDRIALCNSTMLLNFALFNHLGDPNASFSIAACTADLESGSDTGSKSSAATCRPDDGNQTRVTSALQLASSGSSSPAHVSSLVAALDQLRAFSNVDKPRCNDETVKFSYSGQVVVGVYVGAELTSQGIIASVLEQLRNQVQKDGSIAENLLVQHCHDRSARYSLGIFANTKADLASVQLVLQSWKNGSCIATMEQSTPAWQSSITYLTPSLLGNSSSDSSLTGNVTREGNSAHLVARSPEQPHKLVATRDGTCKTVQVVAGDSCGSLAAQCGITPEQFTQYNPKPNMCATLAVGQHVCCSAGSLPDNRPKPGSNNRCYSYLVVTGDSCSALAAAYDLTVDDIEKFNTATWGWNGCANLFASYSICLSTGYPPMPAPIANAVCGPQVNETAIAPPGTDLRTLNECPLKACCNIWGQCGTTSEFCTPSNSTTGAPGTAAPGQNGCISNCGTNIVTSSAPAQTFEIAYFEAFDWQRPCLHMSVMDIDTSAYTHIHFSFATLNADFSINTNTISSQLPLLQGMAGIKRIISIGGWSFSTDPGTYAIFRNAVSSEANRAKLISNVVDFLNTHNLDGVDWDWEYPDEPDIPGIPAGTVGESIGFFLLLDKLKGKMPAGKTVSLTAPASFWYLQHFPIQALSQVVDYIVYMTYDLHGQWDYANKFANPGCPGGNCLRSHVNMTETMNALSMITKAGVPSSMIAVGVSSYGRSFKMNTPGCWTEDCTFSGPASGALKGPCTDTAGYISDFEINLILSNNPSAKQFWDANSYSNIVVYNDTEWVAYMDKGNKATRKSLYKGLTFLGTADWAVDLQAEGGGASPPGSSSSNETIYISPDIWHSPNPQVAAQPGVTLIWPPMPLSSQTTISFPLWTTTITYASLTTLTSTLDGGLTSTYPWYNHISWLTVLTIPPVTTTAIPVWGISFGASETGGPIYLTSSVQPPPFAVTITPVMNGTTSIIGATTTSTIAAGIIIWGSRTYSYPPETETLGGKTTIIGGTTLPPTSITVTPNPHPTTVDSTTDPMINPTKFTWTSGNPPKPTGKPGCPGCGFPCLLFCDPGCPFCPPGVFGGHGSGGDGGDGKSSTSSRTSTNHLVHTILSDSLRGDTFADYDSLDKLESLASEQASISRSLYHDPSASSSTTIPTTTSSSTPPPTPSADCDYWDQGWGLTFEVYNIGQWLTDHGSSLHNQENGCGALTGWDWHDATSLRYPFVYFNLPYFIKDGCVERAIVSAGGPKIQCVGHGITIRALEARKQDMSAAHPPSFTPEEMQAYKEFYSNDTAFCRYSPMDWSGYSSTQSLPR